MQIYAISRPQGQLTLVPCRQGQLYCASQMRCKTLSSECFSWWGARPVLPSVVASEATGPTLYSTLFSDFGGFRSCEHQNRQWLHQGHEPRHGLKAVKSILLSEVWANHPKSCEHGRAILNTHLSCGNVGRKSCRPPPHPQQSMPEEGGRASPGII